MQQLPGATVDLLDETIRQAVFQPIVDLFSREQVGAEAFARWPALGMDPLTAFSRSVEDGSVALLDVACVQTALGTAVAQGAPRSFALFVNLEPSTISLHHIEKILEVPHGHCQPVAEVPEIVLASRPAETLRCIARLRASGWGIALVGVGANPNALGLLTIAAPDVIKLDRSFLQSRLSIDAARVVTSLTSYTERSGATVIAEGIETRAELQQAVALGATLGQGWYLGYPGDLDGALAAGRGLVRHRPRSTAPKDPWDLVEAHKIRVAKKNLLVTVSKALELRAQSLSTPPVVVTMFDSSQSFTTLTGERVEQIARRCSYVAVLGPNGIDRDLEGVRCAELDPGSPMATSWAVIIVHPSHAVMLLARDIGDDVEDGERRYEFVLTYDVETVVGIARSCLDLVYDPPAPTEWGDHTCALPTGMLGDPR